MTTTTTADHGLFIVLISVHGLIRGSDPELGRDADTGGQVRYVLELARALGRHPDVDRVELLTRQIVSVNLDPIYAEPEEPIGEDAFIVRLPCGPHRYLRKESLWPHLPHFVDEALHHFRALGRAPDVVHGHYADAGAVATRLAHLLDRPLVHTGHSLGRVKRARLAERGLSAETLERRYRLSQRIAAEESVLEAADLVVASTRQEADEQWAAYRSRPKRAIRVIPPGVDLSKFRPVRRFEGLPPVAASIDRFLAAPRKPMILALQRPDERKNLATLIEAFGRSDELRRLANLVLMIGSRDDLESLDRGARQEIEKLLHLVDHYDLYGSVAYPKRHSPDDVPDLYRLAAARRGVFVNPALTEPFGLTLIEAAASGLPVVATEDGGPRTILELCRHGRLVDPLDAGAIASALLALLGDRDEWLRASRAGVRGARRHFSWQGHVDTYLGYLKSLLRRRWSAERPWSTPLLAADRLLVTDIDNTLLGDDEGLARLLATLERHRDRVAFGIATGRTLSSALEILAEHGVPRPDVLVTSVGSEIWYGSEPPWEDLEWRREIDREWRRDAVRGVLEGRRGLRLQAASEQRAFKVSFTFEPGAVTGARDIGRLLASHGLEARVIVSHRRFLDVLPRRAGKGAAVRYLARRWGFPLERVLVAGDSGNDAAMLLLDSPAVVVGNHDPELAPLRGRDGLHFARGRAAAGVLEGAEHLGFFADDDAAAGGER